MQALKEFGSVFRNKAFPPYVIGVGFYRVAIATTVFITPFVSTKVLGSYPVTQSDISLLHALGGLRENGTPDWELAAGYMMMIVLVGAAALFPLVSWLVRKTGKRLLYVLSLAWLGLTLMLMSTLGWWPFLSPIFQAIILYVLASFPVAVALVVIRPILADIIDADEELTNRRREGVYNGMEGLILKIGAGIGPLGAGLVFSAFGSTPTHNLGIRLCGPLAGLCLIAAAFSFTRYPIKQ
jgi:Na+/melibiose symporter-like transporter